MKIRTMCYRGHNGGPAFLAYISYQSVEEVQAEADRINKEKPEKLWNGELAHCDKRFYFCGGEQEEF